jgi:heat shock protein HslJ
MKSLTIDDGQVIVELVTQGPDDPLCCPTWNVRKLLNLEDDQLVEQSSQELSKVSLDDLNGTSWQLIDLNLDQEPVLPETEITLSIDDGQINGSTGCNSYHSVVAGDEVMPQTFLVDSIDDTKNLCSGPIATQETTYLQRLASVESWRYDFGYLSLIYKLEQDVFGELLFAPK